MSEVQTNYIIETENNSHNSLDSPQTPFTVVIMSTIPKIIVLLAFFYSIHLRASENFQRIISLSGSITEIVYALGQESKLVGTDTTSYYPPDAEKLPKVGYMRSLSLEGILSLKPDLVIGTEEAGPPEVLEKLRKLGIRLEIIPGNYGLEATINRIRFVGETLGVSATSDILAKKIEHNVRKLSPPWKKKPVILFVFSRGKNTILVSGKETAANSMLELVGSENFIQEFNGYKVMNPELLMKRKLNLILTTNQSIKSLGGIEGLWEMPGFRNFEKSKRPAVIIMDDLLLLGFSSRLDEALKELQDLIQKNYKSSNITIK